jgi:CRP-like cAMP-binding protein
MAGTGIHPSSIQNHLLRRLASEQLDRLCPHLELVELPLRLVLQSRGQPVEFAYFPESAMASFIVPLTDGGSVEVGMVGREGMIGSGIVLGSDTAAHDAMIQIPGKALRISWGSLRDAIRQTPISSSISCTISPSFNSKSLRRRPATPATTWSSAARNGS